MWGVGGNINIYYNLELERFLIQFKHCIVRWRCDKVLGETKLLGSLSIFLFYLTLWQAQVNTPLVHSFTKTETALPSCNYCL